ncbi:50S ribosomal protein L32e [Candidatus Pacearchaeota archaeon]|nr:50S ribosomal protein L32e [Candidatus Pacearchaeota archaeon]|tara:strand:- start:8044 stop:8382 length:339 start_codon:yes stop_codon:yes gene_type:complete
MGRKFVRQETNRHIKLGKKSKSKQSWRKPKGRDSKIRLNRKSYPAKVKIGYQTARKEQKEIKVIRNLKDLVPLEKNQQALLSATLGAKKKLDVIKKAQSLGIKLLNLKGEKK